MAGALLKDEARRIVVNSHGCRSCAAKLIARCDPKAANAKDELPSHGPVPFRRWLTMHPARLCDRK
jgi:hypothetical protein